MTSKQFMAKIESMLREGHTDADDLRFEWVWPVGDTSKFTARNPRMVTFPTGVRGFTGFVRVSATGFRTRVMNATGGGNIGGFHVR